MFTYLSHFVTFLVYVGSPRNFCWRSETTARKQQVRTKCYWETNWRSEPWV